MEQNPLQLSHYINQERFRDDRYIGSSGIYWTCGGAFVDSDGPDLERQEYWFLNP
jgi:hypothetical protein